MEWAAWVVWTTNRLRLRKQKGATQVAPFSRFLMKCTLDADIVRCAAPWPGTAARLWKPSLRSDLERGPWSKSTGPLTKNRWPSEHEGGRQRGDVAWPCLLAAALSARRRLTSSTAREFHRSVVFDRQQAPSVCNRVLVDIFLLSIMDAHKGLDQFDNPLSVPDQISIGISRRQALRKTA